MSQIILASVANYGGNAEVTFAIDGKRYVYFIESFWVDTIEKRDKHSPGRALAMAKKHGKVVNIYEVDK